MKLTDEDLKIAPELRGLNAGNVGDVLNNFFQHFAMVEMDGPEGESSKASEGYYRFTHNELGSWDSPYEKGKKKGQTPRAFYAELDRTIAEKLLSKKKVSTAATLMHLSQCIGFRNIEEWIGPLLVVYIGMRQKGYTHQDLRG